MRDETAAMGFSALGNQSRLAIFRTLVRAGERGLSVGAIHEALGIPLSTLAHHLTALVGAGLVSQEKSGRTVVCRADYRHTDALVGYLMEKCCEGVCEDAASQEEVLET